MCIYVRNYTRKFFNNFFIVLRNTIYRIIEAMIIQSFFYFLYNLIHFSFYFFITFIYKHNNIFAIL